VHSDFKADKLLVRTRAEVPPVRAWPNYDMLSLPSGEPQYAK